MLDETIKKLKISNIETIEDLCNKTKTSLKKEKFSQEEITKIQIELQLLGLNVKGGL